MMIGPVSGGHVNPAVSTSVLTMLPNKGKNIMFYLMIIAAQILGAFAGCFEIWIANGKNFPAKAGYGVAKLCPPRGSFPVSGDDKCTGAGSVLAPVVAEFYGTFIFTSVILSVKAGITASNHLAVNALVIAGTLYCVCQMTANISGAAINPAVGIAQTIF
jgi:glycerol uptake facilitator-like aquaporin